MQSYAETKVFRCKMFGVSTKTPKVSKTLFLKPFTNSPAVVKLNASVQSVKFILFTESYRQGTLNRTNKQVQKWEN